MQHAACKRDAAQRHLGMQKECSRGPLLVMKPNLLTKRQQLSLERQCQRGCRQTASAMLSQDTMPCY